MVYKFTDGETYKGLKAATVGTELEKLRIKNGGKLLTSEIVKSAKAASSPLHEAFTWDDRKAATEYRKWEANHLVKALVIVEDSGEEKPAYYHVRLKQDEENGMEHFYQSVRVVLTKPDEFKAALDLCKSYLEAAEQSLNSLIKIASTPHRKQKIKKSVTHVQKARLYV